jgi:hypothetical protein
MKKIEFKTHFVDGKECVMSLKDLAPKELRFNIETREITIVCGKQPVPEDLSKLNWHEVKRRVEAKGGTWVNKKEGISFLLGETE